MAERLGRGRIKRRLAEGGLVRIFTLGAIASHKLIEMAGDTGMYHGVWIDQEHAGLTQREMEVLTLACRAAGLDSYVRLAPTDYATVMRGFETGAGGVMAAQIRSLDEVRQFIAWAKFPPVGIRGMNTGNVDGDWALAVPRSFAEESNRDRWFAVQIETADALDQVERIAAEPGVDHLFVGPLDLSVTMGVPGDFLHPKSRAALERAAKACKAEGKSWGIVPRGRDHGDFCRALGCQLFALGMDLNLFHTGFKAIRETWADYLTD
jgi:2-dehydro-3-deoxyglucarate aldolase/4-hydroxy-2-oxoheptanedioate aldolase